SSTAVPWRTTGPGTCAAPSGATSGKSCAASRTWTAAGPTSSTAPTASRPLTSPSACSAPASKPTPSGADYAASCSGQESTAIPSQRANLYTASACSDARATHGEGDVGIRTAKKKNRTEQIPPGNDPLARTLPARNQKSTKSCTQPGEDRFIREDHPLIPIRS